MREQTRDGFVMSVPSRAARYQQAQQLYGAKRFEEALVALDQLAQEVPDHPDLLYARTLCLSSLGRKDEALRTCDRLIATHGHAKAQHLKARILAREPEPDLIELGPVNTGAKPARPRRRLAPLAVVVVLVAIVGGIFAYLQYSQGSSAGGANSSSAAVATPDAQRTSTPVALQGGVSVELVNNTNAHLDIWVDQISAQDAPALRVAPAGTQSISLREGTRQVRARATFDEKTRFFTAPHSIEVSGAGTLAFDALANGQGITEITIGYR